MANITKDEDKETPLIGSGRWTIERQLPGDWQERIKDCEATTDWKAVASLCSSLRGGVACEVSPKMTTGTRRLVRLVEFGDGVKWVACIKMGPLYEDGDAGATSTSNSELAMKREIATYNYMREKTLIPVPEIFKADAKKDNAVGNPYMIMQYIHGSPPDEFAYAPWTHAATEEQFDHLLRQMVHIMVELAQCKFDRIGSIFQDEVTEEYHVGVDLETDLGPFETSSAYYYSVAMHRFKEYYTRSLESNLEVEQAKGFGLPLIFNNLFPLLSNPNTNKGPFSLVNMDFGLHSVLVDESFNVKAVIDCDAVMSAPLQSVAQYPELSLMDRVRPGITTARPLPMKSHEMRRKNINRFYELLVEAERSFSPPGQHLTPIADEIVCDGHRLVAGLNDYDIHDDRTNEQWLKSYWYMYYRHVKGEKHASKIREIIPAGYESDEENDGEDEGTESKEDSRGQSDEGSAGEENSDLPKDQERDANASHAEEDRAALVFQESGGSIQYEAQENVPSHEPDNILRATQSLSLSGQGSGLPLEYLGVHFALSRAVGAGSSGILDEGNLIEGKCEKTADEEDDPFESDESVEIITCDTHLQRERLGLGARVAEGRNDAADFAQGPSMLDGSSDACPIASGRGVNITIDDTDRFEGLRPDAPEFTPGSGVKLDDWGIGIDVGKVNEEVVGVDVEEGPDGKEDTNKQNGAGEDAKTSNTSGKMSP